MSQQLNYIGQFVYNQGDEVISVPIKYHLSSKQAEQYVYCDGNDESRIQEKYKLSTTPVIKQLIVKNDVCIPDLKLSLTFTMDDVKCGEYNKFILEPKKIVWDGIEGRPINGYDTQIYAIHGDKQYTSQIILAVKSKHTNKCVDASCYCEPFKYELLDVYSDDGKKFIIDP